MKKKTAIIIGAGPAGLTAAYQLLEKTDILPVIYEMDSQVGGICKTIVYKGNRLDIGGHRFFSKSKRIIDWWHEILPLQGAPARDQLNKHGKNAFWHKDGPDPEQVDRVMLIRDRRSRIYFRKQFFDYPLSFDLRPLLQLGPGYFAKIVLSYAKSHLFPIKPEKNLEDFLVNRFGWELYNTFFKSYTEKVWGVSCRELAPEWGKQRIKGLSLLKAVLNKFRLFFRKSKGTIEQGVETSLIERFMYPKYGPGQMWQKVAQIIGDKGANVHTGCRIVGMNVEAEKIISVKIQVDGNTIERSADYFFSTMPVKELIACMGNIVPRKVAKIAQGLLYRDFITVGVLLKKLTLKSGFGGIPPDNWIYVHEPAVKVGRIQIFNNWSPYLLNDPDTVWIGMEYFCNEGDFLWNKADEEFIEFAIDELAKIGIAERQDVLDNTIVRMLKTYPAYYGSYRQFHSVREFVDRFANLFLIGRNGMHRYNNQDHSMLTAMVAVENIVAEITGKENIWDVNVEQDYLEEK